MEGIRIVDKHTLFELKQINLVEFYLQVCAHESQSHAVQKRADSVHTDYRRNLHNADRAAGTTCPHGLLASRKCCRSDNEQDHTVGGVRLTYSRSTASCGRSSSATSAS